MRFLEVGGKPCKVEVRVERGAHDNGAQHDDTSVGQNGTPWYRFVMGEVSGTTAGCNQVPFCLIGEVVLLGCIAKPGIEPDCPNQTKAPEDYEVEFPDGANQIGGECGSDRSAEEGDGEH